jgi:hypothetical protein
MFIIVHNSPRRAARYTLGTLISIKYSHPIYCRAQKSTSKL